jgi:hypothetical protein
MALELLYAMTLRDGGTTFVVVDEPALGQVTYEFDYSLPSDGRLRYITKKSADGSSCTLEPKGPQELAACELIKSLLSFEFGAPLVTSYMRGTSDNPGKDKWFYAFNFLRLAAKEGKVSG